MAKPFDWLAFLGRLGIDYIERGANVAKEHIAIRCPFCREDPSHHMGLSLQGKGWGCWRDESHRGGRPERLIMALARCSWDEAKAIAEDGAAPTDIGWAAMKAKLELNKDLPSVWPPPTPQQFPEEFFPLARLKGTQARFLQYLRGRGFGSDARAVAKRYLIKGAVRGPFKERIILPVFFEHELVGWTGRAIGNAKLRYKAHPPGETLSHLIFNYDPAFSSGGRVLVVCEGPMDALKVDFYGRAAGVRSVALMGLSLSGAKMMLLSNLSARFDSVVLSMDSAALHKGLDFMAKMQWTRAKIKVGQLPEGVKDPGDLAPEEVLTTYAHF